MTQTYPRWFSRTLYVLMALAILIRLFYWHYTERTWEDALITVLHSENFVRGLGLTHLQPAGQPPLHGFTSPLSVLIPLVGDLVHVGWGLPFLKLVSAFAAPIAVWLGARIAQVVGLPPALALAVAAFLAFEHHQILWGMAGMETEVVILAYLSSIYALQRGTQWQKGLSLGFIMLARPDAAIWVAIVFALELWRAKKAHPASAASSPAGAVNPWRGLIPVVAGLVILYGPWLLFTTVYYGSPVPNTIRAKSLGYTPARTLWHHSPHKLQWFITRVFDVLGSLGPAYAGNGSTFLPVFDRFHILAGLMIIFGIAGLVFALKRRHLSALILYIFVLTYSGYLMFFAPIVFGWYSPPIAAVAVIGAFYGLWALAVKFLAQPLRERAVAAAALVYILFIVAILPWTFRSDKYIQKDIESGVRKQMGLYLGRVSLPSDTIASESLG
jgi:hypothetical protein